MSPSSYCLEAPSYPLDLSLHIQWASLVAQTVKSPLQCRRPGFDSWVGKIPPRREWQPTPVFLPGESHGQRSLAGYSPRDHKKLDTAETLTLSLSLYIFSRTLPAQTEAAPRLLFSTRHLALLSISSSLTDFIWKGKLVSFAAESLTSSLLVCTRW